MKVELIKHPGGPLEIQVTLSRSNINTLLTKLAEPNGDRTITKKLPTKLLTVIGEEDITHYKRRS